MEEQVRKKPETKPRPYKEEGHKIDEKYLVAGRYGTREMCEALGPDQTIESILTVQGNVAQVVSEFYPGKLPPELAEEIQEKADLKHVDPAAVKAEEERTGHDVLGVTNTLSKVLSTEAKPHTGKYMTSADSTETGKALRLKKSLEILIESGENLRDIVLEQALAWKDMPHMQVTHLFDAVPETFGRAFAHYAERLSIRIERLKYVYDNSVYGKYSDATGNYHAANAVGVNGIKLEDELCRKLGIKHMIASSQVPAREFITDIVGEIAKYMEVVSDLAHHIRWLKSSDVDCIAEDKKDKGSSAMPHKDMKGGNPTVEEQAESFASLVRGYVLAELSSNRMDYARDLSGSASDRSTIDDSFKVADFITRRMANLVYNLYPNERRINERMKRTFGVTTSSRVLAYLTDIELVSNPIARREAHNLLGELATAAYNQKRLFSDVLAENEAVSSRLSREKIAELSDPFTYLGESVKIIEKVFKEYHQKKTFEKAADVAKN